MYQENIVLCAASAYEEKYYLNEDFKGLPKNIKDELQIMCVLYTADIGGTFRMEFMDDGSINMISEADEGDILYDEIGSVLKIKQLQEDKRELLESLTLYYKTFFLNEDI